MQEETVVALRHARKGLGPAGTICAMSTPISSARRNLGLAPIVLAAAAVLVIGVVLRAWILRSAFGVLNGDEAYSGLQSIDVIRDGRFPIVMDGSVYTAAIDAYFFSPLMVFAGGSIAVLKWGFSCVWLLVVGASFGGARYLAGRRAAAFSATLVLLAPGALLVLSTRSYMGYALGLSVAAATVWATAVVSDQATAKPRSSAIVGFLAGLAFFIHPMWVTMLGPVVAVACVVHIRDWRRWWAPAAGGALLANTPFLLWNASNGWPSLNSQVYPPGSYLDRLTGFATGLMPRALGLRTLDGRWVFGKPIGVAIYLLIAVGVVVGCVHLVRSSQRPSRWIVPIGLALCFPAMALLPHLIFVLDGRYGIIPFPLIAIALGAALSRAVAGFSPRQALASVLVLAVVWASVTIVPFMQRQQMFERAEPNAWIDRVINRLDEVGIDRVAGSYWMVLPLEYRSDQRIRTAIAGNPYVIRFPSSQRIVGRAPADEVAFLFPPGEQPPGWFYLPVDEYRQEDLGGVILYLPPAAGA